MAGLWGDKEVGGELSFRGIVYSDGWQGWDGFKVLLITPVRQDTGKTFAILQEIPKIGKQEVVFAPLKIHEGKLQI